MIFQFPGVSRKFAKETNLKATETDVCEERRLKRTEREKQREEQRRRREERRKEREMNKITATKIQKQSSTGKIDTFPPKSIDFL